MVNIRVLANAKLSNSYPGVNVSVKLGSSVLPHHLETLARNIWLNFHDDKNNFALSQYTGHMAVPWRSTQYVFYHFQGINHQDQINDLQKC